MQLLIAVRDYAIPFLVILTVLVFVHELGHFCLARRNRVRVETFSIGFGPELFGFNDRKGTRWKFSALPLGGYVKMFGEGEGMGTGAAAAALSPEERAVSFHHKTLGQRAAIVAGGPLANFIFAIVVLTGLFAIVGQPFTAPVVDEVMEAGAAEKAGVKPGDRFLTVDGQSISRFEELQRLVQDSPGRPLEVVLDREGQALRLTVTPTVTEQTDRFGNRHVIGLLGVRSHRLETVRHDPLTAVWQASRETAMMTVGTLKALGQIIVGSRGTEELGGPLRIAQMSGEVAQGGLVATFWFMAVLSINLGLINLFPIPVLDGGHLLFYGAEALRGRPLGPRAQDYASMAGLALVLALMVFATWNDLVHLRVVDFIGRLFT
ncbi:MAG: RIP metalloprotease RseP [Proteobacteria bacterium]|nr:RIP metalloprotease RseP [Pseudomonadota bacterium]MBI3496885.1 RIP metalloprotease RseP [Pseudomonadota bacterium]